MKKQAMLLLMPLVMVLTGCTQEVSLKEQDSTLVQPSVTRAAGVVVFPDDNPSVPDGKVVWEKQNCASCHGADGKGVAGQTDFDLTNKEWMRRETMPLDQYVFLAYGKQGVDHPALNDKLTRNQIWSLVFYSRSLAVPAITDAEFDVIDPVFGANCAVCHGKRGHGDGPLARNMEPLPANFHQYNRFYDRTDETLWNHIAYGIKWEGMPNFLGKKDKDVTFDDEYIWKLVQYVRNFHSSNKPTLSLATPETDAEFKGQSARGLLENEAK